MFADTHSSGHCEIKLRVSVLVLEPNHWLFHVLLPVDLSVLKLIMIWWVVCVKMLSSVAHAVPFYVQLHAI